MPKSEAMDWAQASWALPRRKKVRISNSNGFIGPGFIYSLLWFFQGGFQSCQEVRLVARQPARELPAASQLDYLYEKVIPARSEEHTSELQSPDHLVCRLLLEKKKKKNKELSI